MIVSTPRPARPYADLADVTSKEVLRRGWVTHPDGIETYEVQFAVNLTAEEVEAVRLRLTTRDANEETTRARAWETAETLRQVRDTGHDTILAPLVMSRAIRLFARVLLYLLRLQLQRTETVEAEPPTGTPPPPQTIAPGAGGGPGGKT